MSSVPDRSRFESMYAGKAPWDIGKPQPQVVAIADRVTSPILDAGCGTGENALFFAARGHRVTGIDFVEEAVRRARIKADERRIRVEFLVKDATSLHNWNARFSSVIDCGLFHVFSDSDRVRYVEGLTQVTESNGNLFLMCFSDEEPGTAGPRRVAAQDLYDAFADGWKVESMDRFRFEVNEHTDVKFSEGGPKAWFTIVRRV